MRHAIIHFSEIGLKKGNKKYFVGKLIDFLKLRLEKTFKLTHRIVLTLDRILIPLEDSISNQDYAAIFGKIFGIKNFMFVKSGPLDLQTLGDKIFEDVRASGLDFQNFCVRVKRSQKWEFSSSEAERELGAILLKKGLNMPVRLKNPDLEVNVEVFNDIAFYSLEKFPGLAGLPPASNSKLISLISSGIDSPVASYLMMKRGARVIFVHFHAYPYTDAVEMENVKKIVERLSIYQNMSKIYLIPFGEIQEEIAANLNIAPKYRTIIYRRLMFMVASQISKKEQAKGMVTGDNYGQVASQTPENMFVIDNAVSLPVYRPLIAFDKEEIVEKAKLIDTFEISKLPCKDTCSMFMPKNPEISGNLFDVEKYEKLLSVDEILESALKSAEILLI